MRERGEDQRMKSSFRSTDWQYLLRESALILSLSYFFLLASTHNGLVNFHIFSITIALFFLFEIIWMACGQKVSLKKEIPILIFLGVLIVAACFSIDPRRSFTEVWLLGAALFLFLLSSELVSRGWGIDLWIKALLIVGAIVMIFTWREAVVWYQQWLVFTGKILPEISYRLPAPNFLAVFLNILLMVSVASFLFTKSKAAKLFLGVWAFSALGLIYLTSSRGGWMGTTAGLGSLLFLSALAFPDKRKALFRWLRQHRLVTILLVIGLITLILVFAWIFIQQSKVPTHAAIGDSRSFLWNPAWQAFTQSPIIGSGPYTYISFYVQQQSTPPSPLYLYAHSIYLDLLSGSGVLGLAAFFVMIVCLVIALFKRFRQSSGLERAAAMAALGALAAFLVHGLVDSVHHTIPTVAWLLALVLGAGMGDHEEQKTRRFSFSWLLGLGLVLFGVLNLWAEKPMYEGVIAGNSGFWQDARADMQETIARDPKLAIAYQQYGMVASQLAQDGDAETLQAAIINFEAAIALDQHWSVNYANLGALHRANGDLIQSAQMLEKAVYLAPKSALFQLNLGITYEAMKKEDFAAEAYQNAIQLQPLWRDAYFWRETTFRTAFLADSETYNTEKPGSLAEAEANLASQPHRVASYLDLIPFYLEEGRLEEAQEAIQFAKLAYTGKEEDRLLLKWYEAELAASKEEVALAANLGDETVHRFLQQGVYGPGTFGQLMYDQLVFRRPAIVMEVVPQMTMIMLPDVWGDRMHQTAEWYRQLGSTERAEDLMQELRGHLPDYDLVGE